MGHHRETSAFVPVVPSRNMPHPMLYPGDIHPLLGLENRERNADGGKNTEGRFLINFFSNWLSKYDTMYKLRKKPQKYGIIIFHCQVQVVADKIIQ